MSGTGLLAACILGPVVVAELVVLRALYRWAAGE